ncbi:Thyrostimulin alpha-2 subunit [Blattella germanica]|nr:Thyrostimulin alpha-2 subunit [Blattella germanica]
MEQWTVQHRVFGHDTFLRNNESFVATHQIYGMRRVFIVVCIGHTRKISIPDCVEFHITTNACRGYCESWAVPSALDTLRVNPHQAITSVGQCCNIMDTEDVEVRVMCLDGTRDLVFKSAKSCSCYHCKKD